MAAVDPAPVLDRLCPPSPYRHEAISLGDLRRLAAYIDDRQPFFYNGAVYQLANKRLAPGLYRVWLEESQS